MVSSAQRWAIALVLLGCTAGAIGGYYVWLRIPPIRPNGGTVFPADPPSARTPRILPRNLFAGRPAPDAVLMFTGQTHGYLQPCGCARPQVGGLIRRYELWEQIRARGWPVLAADLGSAASKYWVAPEWPKYETRDQGKEKFKRILETLQLMDYAAVGVGPSEFEMGYVSALDEAQNYWPPYFLAANLADPDFANYEFTRKYVVAEALAARDQTALWGRFAGDGLTAYPASLMTAVGPAAPPPDRVRVAYVGLVADSVAKKVIGEFKKDLGLDPKAGGAIGGGWSAGDLKKHFAFTPIDVVLAKLLPEIRAAAPDLIVLLLQGNSVEAKAIAQKYPDFRVIQTLAFSDQAPSLPRDVIQRETGDTLIIDVGEKGKAVGLVGMTRKDGKWNLMYEMVELTEAYETRDEATDLACDLLNATIYRDENRSWLKPLPESLHSPARRVVDRYVARVHQYDFLGKHPKRKHPLQIKEGMEGAKYVGAASCKECHSKAYDIWAHSKHAKAYDALIDYGKPRTVVRKKEIGREFDPACIGCHTTGYEFESGFTSAEKTPFLKGNQCENCHGPASLHVATAGDKDLETVRKFAAPLRLSLAEAKASHCGKCHDGDNDPNYEREIPFEKYWEKIRHSK